MSNVYLASGFHWRENLRELAHKLIEKKYTICSSWIWLEERPLREDTNWDKFASDIAHINYVDLLIANIIVVDARGIKSDNKGGAHTELGFGLGKGIPVFLIGPKGNTFHWLSRITKVESEEELIRYMELLP